FLLGSSSTLYPYQITVDPASGAPTITSDGAPTGTVGMPFLYTLTATNSPTSYMVAQLPPGLTSSGSQITGTPTAPGLYFTSVSANNGVGQGAILVLMFTINPVAPLPALTSAALVSTPPNAKFSYTITATNNPTSFAATGLPSGLTLDSATGIISGTPTTPQVATIGLTATNSYGTCLPRNLVLTIGDYSSITSAATAQGAAGTAFSYTLAASNSPDSFIVTGLPAGLSMDPVSGLISGTPTSAGTYTLTAGAVNGLGSGPASTITLSITGAGSSTADTIAPQIVTEPLSQSVPVGSNVDLSVAAAGSGALSYQWQLNGVLISGATASTLSLAMVDPSDQGAYTVTVSNATGSIESSAATLTILSLHVPPAITAQPYKNTAATGSSVAFMVGASGSGPLSYQWLFNGAPIGGATTATLNFQSASVSNAGTYSVVVTNPYGSTTSLGAVLNVTAAGQAPIFEFQPSATAVTVGGTATLSGSVVAAPPVTYQWSKDGVAIPGATSPNLTFSPAAASDAGSYVLSITDPAGTVASSSAALTVAASGGAPVPVTIAVQPNPVSTPVGGEASFTAAVTGDATISYQWRKNQAPIAGATGPTFTISDAQYSDTGTYDLVASNGFSTAYSFPTPLTVTPAGVPSHLINVSARGFSGAGAQAMTVGFVIGGSGSESTLVRAVGPTLSEFDVSGILADPQLTLFDSGKNVLATDDNWGGATVLAAAFSAAGAFALPPDSLDAAVLSTLQQGAYTAQVQGLNGETGVVLLELYDADSNANPTAHLINVSVRGLAGSGSSVLTVGFVIAGPSPKTVLIRGIGPTLTEFSVSGALADPQLTVFDRNQIAVGYNDNWGGTAELQAAFSVVGAFQLSPTTADSALLITLNPGTYTAQVRGAGGSTGIALLEVYEMP
ncbi:MAG TPA: immunoglobulin domain-containing protein, partial [Opitutaceae bacterium]|nr:immunoglobulin domain-containing protein [Opitutaceae bacterium]